jgi:hypothetical protein
MIAQGINGGRRHSSMFILVAVALLALAVTASAGAAVTRARGVKSCAAGSRPVTKVVRKHGRTTVIRACKRKAPAAAPTVSPAPESPAPAPTASASSSTPSVGGGATPADTSTLPEVITEPPLGLPGAEPPAEEPEGEEPSEESETEEPSEESESEEPTGKSPVAVHAAIRTGFEQNPLVPNEVTWHYSASATKVVTLANGTEKTEAAPLPAGELAFFVDGKLECEIHVVGSIAGSACTTVLKRLGAHEVEAIFSNESAGDIASRTDLISKYPTSTSLQVSIEPVAPEYLDIGPNAYGYEQYAFEVGRLRISGATTPGGVPTFDCAGQGVGCIEPEVGLNRNGVASIPLYAQHRLNMKTGLEEWHVGFPAYSPSLRESNWFWQFPEESIGTEFFHAVSEPNTSLYVPSSITLPLNLNGGHYPLYHWFREGEGGGSVAAVEGTAVHALSLGTYDKVDGAETTLKFTSRFNLKSGEAEGCVYRLHVDGQDRNETRTASSLAFEVNNGYQLPAGPHTFELWVERKAGAGPGNCQINSGTFEAYEKIH